MVPTPFFRGTFCMNTDGHTRHQREAIESRYRSEKTQDSRFFFMRSCCATLDTSLKPRKTPCDLRPPTRRPAWPTFLKNKSVVFLRKKVPVPPQQDGELQHTQAKEGGPPLQKERETSPARRQARRVRGTSFGFRCNSATDLLS